MRVLVIIDVEEEGLFTGTYPRSPSVDNVAALPELAFITQEFGIPLTLVCAWPVFANAAACKVLAYMRDTLGAEIGAHLHHWSTPPFDTNVSTQYTPAHMLPQDVLRRKLHTLFTAARDFQGQAVTSFRMGRWDAHASLWPLLTEQGVRVDSSVRPWHYPAGWRDHFFAPTTPYTMPVGEYSLLEVPDTAVPLLPRRAQLCYKAPALLLHKAHQLIVMTLSPVYHSLAYMKMAARLLLAQGRDVLTLTWHSSETMGGATPHLPSHDHVRTMLERVRQFLTWLQKERSFTGVTLGDMQAYPAPTLNAAQRALPGDWHPAL